MKTLAIHPSLTSPWQQVASACPTFQSTAAVTKSSILFGASQKTDETDAVPPHIKAPKFTMPDFYNQLFDIRENEPKGLSKLVKRFTRIDPRVVGLYAKLIWHIGKLIPHLPKSSLKRLTFYVISPTFIKDIYNHRSGKDPGIVWRKLISFAGPPIVKVFQEYMAQELSEIDEKEVAKEVEKLEKELATLEQKTDNQSRIEARGIKHHIAEKKRRVKMKQIFVPLLHNVPPVKQREVQKDLNVMVKAFNTQYPNDPIVDIGKNNANLIGSASTAQVYKGQQKSGKLVALKVYRPDVTKAYIHEFRESAYRLFMFLTMGQPYSTEEKGSEAYQKDIEEQQEFMVDHQKLLWKASKGMADVLEDEIQPEFEKRSAERLKKALKQAGIKSIHIPQVYMTSERGFVEEFVQGEPLSKVSRKLKRKVMNDILPDLMRIMMILPVKHNDLHDGNIMVHQAENGKTTISLIDFGRSVFLEDSSNAKLLYLLKTILAQQTEATQIKALDTVLKTPGRIDAKAKKEFLQHIKHGNALRLLENILNPRTALSQSIEAKRYKMSPEERRAYDKKNPEKKRKKELDRLEAKFSQHLQGEGLSPRDMKAAQNKFLKSLNKVDLHSNRVPRATLIKYLKGLRPEVLSYMCQLDHFRLNGSTLHKAFHEGSEKYGAALNTILSKNDATAKHLLTLAKIHYNARDIAASLVDSLLEYEKRGRSKATRTTKKAKDTMTLTLQWSIVKSIYPYGYRAKVADERRRRAA